MHSTNVAGGSRGKTLQFSEVCAMRDIIMRFNTLVLAKRSDQRAATKGPWRPCAISSSASASSSLPLLVGCCLARTKEAAANKKRKFVLKCTSSQSEMRITGPTTTQFNEAANTRLGGLSKLWVPCSSWRMARLGVNAGWLQKMPHLTEIKSLHF